MLQIKTVARATTFLCFVAAAGPCMGSNPASSAPSPMAYLSQDELNLAHDTDRIMVDQSVDMTGRSFNLEDWPSKCNAGKLSIPNALGNPCNGAEKETNVGLRNIRITGLVLVVDRNEWPWNLLDRQYNILSLEVEAEKIVVRTDLNLPSTNLTLHADKIIFESNGILNVSPINYVTQPIFDQKKNQSMPGSDGLPGSSISIAAASIEIVGPTNKAHLVATGGKGQQGGAGWGS